MLTNDYFIVFPEGDVQEIPGRLRLNEMVDMNGRPLALPLPDPRVIAYRVSRISTKDERGGSETYHYLDLLDIEELRGYARNR